MIGCSFLISIEQSSTITDMNTPPISISVSHKAASKASCPVAQGSTPHLCGDREDVGIIQLWLPWLSHPAEWLARGCKSTQCSFITFISWRADGWLCSARFNLVSCYVALCFNEIQHSSGPCSEYMPRVQSRTLLRGRLVTLPLLKTLFNSVYVTHRWMGWTKHL